MTIRIRAVDQDGNEQWMRVASSHSDEWMQICRAWEDEINAHNGDTLYVWEYHAFPAQGWHLKHTIRRGAIS